MFISIYRTGSDGGETGPTSFLPNGKKRHISYIDNYLITYGVADGSTIYMTDNGHMKLKAWEELMTKMSKGI